MITMQDLRQVQLVDVIEFLGTIAFAISGIRLASAKKFDWFGAIVVGFVTAIGGGTLRDILLDVTPFWMQSSIYLWGTVLAFLIVVLFRKFLVHLNNTIFWFDCIGLGLFVVVGYEKTMMLGYAVWVCIFMGTITGIVGGILRDILINEIPIIFTQELYAVACIIGGIIFAILIYFGVDLSSTEIITAVAIVIVRILAIRFSWRLPTLKSED